MQVEVSKYTEGVNDKALRPNGLSKSLIRYDGLCDNNDIVQPKKKTWADL